MKEFAGIGIDRVDIESAQSLNSVREHFLNNYHDNYFIPKDLADAEKVIRPLRSYIQMNLVPTRNLDQSMAMIIKYLPDDGDYCGNLNDELKLLVLKINLRQSGCGGESGYAFRDLDFKQRCAMIERVRRKICFHDDWDYAVRSTYSAFHRKTFAMADAALNQIKEMSNSSNKTIKREDLPYIISLQLAYYAEIINYLRDRCFSEAIMEFYNKIKQEFACGLKKLKEIPEPSKEATRTCSLAELFFLHGHDHKNNQIAPELKEPWIADRKKRRYF